MRGEVEFIGVCCRLKLTIHPHKVGGLAARQSFRASVVGSTRMKWVGLENQREKPLLLPLIATQ